MRFFPNYMIGSAAPTFWKFPYSNLSVILFPKALYKSSILSIYHVTCFSIIFSPSIMQSIITLKILIKDSTSYHILTFIN